MVAHWVVLWVAPKVALLVVRLAVRWAARSVALSVRCGDSLLALRSGSLCTGEDTEIMTVLPLGPNYGRHLAASNIQSFT